MTIKSKESVKRLGVTIYDKLPFGKHIKKFCRSASCRLNAILRLKNILNFYAKKFSKKIISIQTSKIIKTKKSKKSKILKNELLNTCMMIFLVANLNYFEKQIKTTLTTQRYRVVMYRNF